MIENVDRKGTLKSRKCVNSCLHTSYYCIICSIFDDIMKRISFQKIICASSGDIQRTLTGKILLKEYQKFCSDPALGRIGAYTQQLSCEEKQMLMYSFC